MFFYVVCFFFNETATTEIYTYGHTLSPHAALPIFREKSLGAIAKSGTTNLVDVLEYAQPVSARGLVFMDTPGYDPVSATGQVAGGANLICFTTGRGSAYGCAPAPSLKLATNTELWLRQADDLDINCRDVVDGRSAVHDLDATGKTTG